MDSSLNLPISQARKYFSGWVGIGIFALGYAAAFVANFWLPISVGGSYTFRIWNWTHTGLTLVALIVLVLKMRFITPQSALLGLALAVLTGVSTSLRNVGMNEILWEGFAVWACFLAGTGLFKQSESPGIPAFQSSVAKIGRSLAFGVVAAVPLAVLNNLYFYSNSGEISLQNAWTSALEALRPGISEEIVYRFLILAISFNLLRVSNKPRLAMAAGIFLAVVPHSLNHLPDLFLENPVMGLILLLVTSVFFGLPMALLQIKRNLETAIAFHWFIDFARFLFGF